MFFLLLMLGTPPPSIQLWISQSEYKRIVSFTSVTVSSVDSGGIPQRKVRCAVSCRFSHESGFRPRDLPRQEVGTVGVNSAHRGFIHRFCTAFSQTYSRSTITSCTSSMKHRSCKRDVKECAPSSLKFAPHLPWQEYPLSS